MTLTGPTNLGLGAWVEADGKIHAFRLAITGFAGGFSQAFSEPVTLDLPTGKTSFVRNIDAAAGTIFGVAPIL